MHRRAVLVVSAALVAAVLVDPSGGSASSPAGAQRATGPGPIRFSHMVVVDEQRPGNEPDVKVSPHGKYFTSIPFGFSTASSFLWRSSDHGRSYHLTAGNIGTGKPDTCAGGGDTDLYIDPGNALYFSDLQGLTNISNSVSTDDGKTFRTTCSGAPNSPVDRMWFAATGSLRKGNLRLYQDYDQVGTAASSANPGGNQLVETVSSDGTTFVPVVNANPTDPQCAGTAVNCVTDNEGISGNQVVDPTTGNVFIAHTTTNGSSGGTVGVQVSEGRIAFNGPTATGTWHESRNLDAALCPHTNATCVDSAKNPTEIAGENFASIARDSAGYLYVTFTAGPVDHRAGSANLGQLTKAEQIYVVRSTSPATNRDPSAVRWTKPMRITGPSRGITGGTNTFPWITAGSRGRVAVAWYHTGTTAQHGSCAKTQHCPIYGASRLTHAEWSVQVAQTVNGTSRAPSWRRANVSEGPVKYGSICTNGIGCATGGDRSLGDFLQVTQDRQGAMLVTYVDDTSANVQAGEATGPEVISRQIGGPSMYAGHRVTLNGGPGRPFGSAGDIKGDAFYAANGTRKYAGTSGFPQLDLRSASISQPRGKPYLLARLHVTNLASLASSPTLGGADASWMLRWTQVHRGVAGNGTIYYVGLDNNGGTAAAKPSFFFGSTSCIPANNPQEHCKLLTYPQNRTITGRVLHKKGIIELRIPRRAAHLHRGSFLRSVTAFDATAATPQSATTVFNMIDAVTPFDVRVQR
ncbi:MAG TPA: hypothetical protein VIG48_08155 [Jatrophihabitans sp.]|jgi:hypothetical protein